MESKRVFWDYISTFWSLLTEKDREMVENLWDGFTTAGGDILKNAQRLFDSLTLKASQLYTFENYYGFQIGPLYSKPINLDITVKEPNFNIIPIRAISSGVEGNYVEITGDNYCKVRDLAKDSYCVIRVDNKNIQDKYFKVLNLLSSEESVDKPCSFVLDNTILPEGSSELFGKIRFTGKPGVDISNYRILIKSAWPNSVAWLPDGVNITFIGTSTIDQIVDNINNSISVDKWIDSCKSISIYDKIPYNGLSTSVYPDDGVFVKNCPEYTNKEASNGRYYPTSGKVWEYFEGYSSSNATEGDIGFGEYVDSKSKFRYMVELDGDLSYIANNTFTIYFTTGRSYDVDKSIIRIDELQNFIDVENLSFVIDKDFSFNNSIIEFNSDILDSSELSNGDYLYCVKTPKIEDNLNKVYGTLVGIEDYLKYNHTNISGKAAIETLMKSKQSIGERKSYEEALNIYFGLPVAPDDCEVDGLYESYGYKIIWINGSDIAIDVKDGIDFHPFFQPGVTLYIPNKNSVVIESIDNVNKVISLVDPGDVGYGDYCYIKLTNRFAIKNIYKENLESDIAATVDIYCSEGIAAINHIIDVIYNTSNQTKYPEILIHGTKKDSVNFDGVYHIFSADTTGTSGIIKLTIYKKGADEDAVYNDYIGPDDFEGLSAGFVHIPWPTHKLLRLKLSDDVFYNAYLDGPIDTIYDTGDYLKKHDIIARNASVLNSSIFDGWNEYDQFKKSNGIHKDTSILELTSSTPGVEFGKYFPSAYQSTT